MTTINRRQSIQTASTLAASFAMPILPAKAANRPPNIIYVICDQMRGDCMSGIGHPDVRTPNIDRLAKRGVLFQNAYSNCPVCVPSRMAAFAGQFPHETGRLSNRSWGSPLLSMPDTMVDHFKQHGYKTGWIGKNHTYTKEAVKDIDVHSIRAREPFRKYNRFVPPQWHCDTLWPEEICHPRKNTDEAVEFIEQSQNDPYFLHVSYFDPHPPYMAPPEFSSRFRSRDFTLPDFIPPANLSQRLDTYARGMLLDRITDIDYRETMKYYYAAIEWGVDYQVGRIIDALDRTNQWDNTVLVFTSDHGDFMSRYRMVRKGMFLYDSLLHVPMIWCAPGRIAENMRTPRIAQAIDLWPAFADFAGLSDMDRWSGRSLKDDLRDSRTPDDDEVFFTSAAYGRVNPDVVNPAIDLKEENETPLHTRIMEQGMEPTYKTKVIRTHEWKMILNEDDPPELYHMPNTHTERENIADKSEFASVRKRLEKRLEEWWKW